jgi:hypothetical protein
MAKDTSQFLLHRVCFLVHESIKPTSWQVKAHDGPNAKMAATLSIKMTTGLLDIHNVYNNRPRLFDVGTLITRVAALQHSLLVGDFNLHYQLWNGDKTFGDVAKVNDLAEGLQGAGMECLTVPGTVTFSRSVSTEYQSSTIDLTFISNHIADRSIDWGLVEMMEFAPDHRVIQTTLDMEPGRHDPLQRLWKKTKPKAFVKAAEPRLAPGQLPVLENAQQNDEYIQKINGALFSAINGCIDTVPRFRPRFQRAPDEELVRLDNQWHRVYVRYMRTRSGRHLNQLKRIAADRDRLERSIKRAQ